ncbi:MAG: hypothetical protein PsegKO_23000 [Pseudohongiellaceae bacterium]
MTEVSGLIQHPVAAPGEAATQDTFLLANATSRAAGTTGHGTDTGAALDAGAVTHHGAHGTTNGCSGHRPTGGVLADGNLLGILLAGSQIAIILSHIDALHINDRGVAHSLATGQYQQ